jgi:hypothetical protein
VLSSPPRPALCSLLSAGAQAPCSTALSPAYPSSLLPMATAAAPCSTLIFMCSISCSATRCPSPWPCPALLLHAGVPAMVVELGPCSSLRAPRFCSDPRLNSLHPARMAAPAPSSRPHAQPESLASSRPARFSGARAVRRSPRVRPRPRRTPLFDLGLVVVRMLLGWVTVVAIVVSIFQIDLAVIHGRDLVKCVRRLALCR